LWERYERMLSAGSLVVGFIFDLFLAKRPDSTLDNILLVSYLFIAAALIIILNIHTNRRRDIEPRPVPLLLLLVLQFCFGGLSSNLLVLYGKSGTLAGSALFILLLAAMLIGNEFLRTRYAQLRFNIAVYYLLLLTYLIIAVPTFIFHSVGMLVFLFSGFLSLLLIGGFLSIVYVAVFRGRQRGQQLYEVSVLVVMIFTLFNGLYFLKIIPPVPLSLKGIGMYHSISRLTAPQASPQGIYTAVFEPSQWFVFWRDTSATYTITSTSAQAACFSSVFAPTNLATPVFHKWEKYDEGAGKWVVKARVSFPINGGRDQGYRGFTLSDVSPGQWRCNVETTSGALIGRISFTVLQNQALPTLSTKTL
jgi:hypothetical protein